MKISSIANPYFKSAKLPLPPLSAPSVQPDKGKIDMIYDSSKQFSDESKLFFIDMLHYPKNTQWAQDMLQFRDRLAVLIKNKVDFNSILSVSQVGLKKMNADHPGVHAFGEIRQNAGGRFLLCDGKRGEEYLPDYFEKYKSLNTRLGTFRPKSNSEYKDASVCHIIPDNRRMVIAYGYMPNRNSNNLEFVKREYDKLKALKNPTTTQVNRSAATIQWLIAQANPFMKGNDSFANLFTKAIYKAYDIHLAPLKKGISLDFEAFYSDLEDYIRKYPTFFEKRPWKSCGL